MKKIFLIAGEASGDLLGSKLMNSLIKQEKEIEFYGVGGEYMSEKGLKSIFPMEELSLLGFVEIIPHIPKLLGRINQVANEIIKVKPDVVVTIDAPLFNNRVAKKLRKLDGGKDIKMVHYVAPTVWAYKPKRAEKISKLYNHLLLLLPFEPPYFERVGLPCTFIGHSILEEDIKGGDGDVFRKKYAVNSNTKLLYLMPASRSGEMKRIAPVFRESIALLKKDFPDLKVIVSATKRFEERLKAEFSNAIIITDKNDKKNAMAASDVALVKSGTGTLEVAIARLPMVIAYKLNPLSAFMLQRMIQVQYVNLLNIIANKEIIPELLQENCTSDKIYKSISNLLNNKDIAALQISQTKKTLKQLENKESISPSEMAAKTILKIM